MFTLYGSKTSPFVRRLRIWLANREHHFVDMQIFDGPDRGALAEKNPAMKIPMLEFGEQRVFDSKVIFRFLSHQFCLTPISWEQENYLTLIDSSNESLAQMFLLSRSGVDTSVDTLYFRLQKERISRTLSYLDNAVAEGKFAEWNFVSMSLYCLIDWAVFRELFDMQPFRHLLSFQQHHVSLPEVVSTDPRMV